MPEEKLTKNARRDAARERAAENRRAAARKAKRNRIVLFSSIGLIVVAIAVIITLVIVNVAQRNAALQVTANGPKNMASGGLVLTSTTQAASTAPSKTTKPTAKNSSKVQVQIYLDVQCPYCNQFETAAHDYIGQQLDAGKLTYEIHPVVFINEYSGRGANAFACVANTEPQREWDYLNLLYQNQPSEETQGGLPTSKLVNLAAQAGVKEASTLACIKDDARYSQWLTATTTAATTKGAAGTDAGKITSTPTVIVDGKKVTFTTDYLGDFEKAVQAAAAAKHITLAKSATPSSTPSVAPTASSTPTAAPSALVPSASPTK